MVEIQNIQANRSTAQIAYGVGENPLNGKSVNPNVKVEGLRNSLYLRESVRFGVKIRKELKMNNFDKEYSTQWVEEMKWLKENGIKYTFVKYINGITTYKYKKTPELFKALSIFYNKK